MELCLMSGCSILFDHGVKGSLEVDGGNEEVLSFQNFEIEFFHDQVEGRVVVYGISVAYGLVLHMTCNWIVVA